MGQPKPWNQTAVSEVLKNLCAEVVPETPGGDRTVWSKEGEKGLAGGTWASMAQASLLHPGLFTQSNPAAAW